MFLNKQTPGQDSYAELTAPDSATSSLSPKSHHSHTLGASGRTIKTPEPEIWIQRPKASRFAWRFPRWNSPADAAIPSCTYIGAIERGERNITLATLERDATALNVDPLKLLNSNEVKETAAEVKKKRLQRLSEILKGLTTTQLFLVGKKSSIIFLIFPPNMNASTQTYSVPALWTVLAMRSGFITRFLLNPFQRINLNTSLNKSSSPEILTPISLQRDKEGMTLRFLV